MNSQTQDTHGHEVMEMMNATGKTYTRATLIKDIVEKFGESTTFCTCAAENMSAEGLLDFLEDRGKFETVVGGFKLASASPQCDHD